MLDVSTRECRNRHGSTNHWYVQENGFWKPGPHLVLADGFDYPEQSLYLDQVIVVEGNGRLWVYRMWFQDFTRDSIIAELEQGGFKVGGVWSDLTGTPYAEDSAHEWLGVVARKI